MYIECKTRLTLNWFSLYPTRLKCPDPRHYARPAFYLQRPNAKCMKMCSISHSSAATYSFITDSWHGANRHKLSSDWSNAVLHCLNRGDNDNALSQVVTITKRTDKTRTAETTLSTYQPQNWPQSGKNSIQSSTDWLPGVLGIICCRARYFLHSTPTRSVMACRAFSQAAPRVQNDLPIDIQIESQWHLTVLDPFLLYALITTDLLSTITVRLDHVNVHSVTQWSKQNYF